MSLAHDLLCALVGHDLHTHPVLDIRSRRRICRRCRRVVRLP